MNNTNELPIRPEDADAIIDNVQKSKKYKQFTDSVAEAVYLKTAPNQPEMDFETIERIAHDLCVSRRGIGAWAVKGCKHNHWRQKARDIIETRRILGLLEGPKLSLKQRFARWVISKLSRAAI